jgi:hypothetical protein
VGLSPVIKTFAVGACLAAGYVRFLRPRVLNWGASPDEIEREMPGDDIQPTPAIETTRVITVNAPPSAIWPWLVQMGPRPRAGVYTYDWIERLLGIDIENSDRILPEFQHMEAGTSWVMDKKGNGLKVVDVQEEHCIVLQWLTGAASSWAFVLYPEPGGTTRLVSRNRIPAGGVVFRLGMLVMEAGSLVMEREMLRGIKRRAEMLAHERQASPATATA